MKIAIASVDKDENSEISSRGGRAPYYLIFNEKREFLETVSNPQFQLFIIFSERLNPFLKNRNLNRKILSDKTLKNSNKFKYHTIQKAKSTFKYYETVLLGIIIKNIDNKTR